METKIIPILLSLFLLWPAKLSAQGWLEKAQADAAEKPGTVNGKTKEDVQAILGKATAGDAKAQYEMYELLKAKGNKTLANEWLQKSISQNYLPALRQSDEFKYLFKAVQAGDSAATRRMQYKLFGNMLPPKKTPPAEQFKAAAPYLERAARKRKEGILAKRLAFMYLTGQTGVKDSIKGMEWMTLSAGWGNEGAQQYLFFKQNEITNYNEENIDIDIPETDYRSKNTFAVIFAIEKYENGTKVSHALNDGRVLRLYLTNTLGIPQKNVQLMENATYNDFKVKMQWISDIIEAFDGQVNILVYFAGQGYIDGNDNTAMLIPSDGQTDTRSSMYPLTDIHNCLQNSKRSIVLLDTNFSDTDRGGKKLVSSRGMAIKVPVEKPKGNIVTVTAANNKEGETAWMYEIKHHGLFTYHLLKKLQQSKGNTTWGDLMDTICEEVNRSSLKSYRQTQSPQIYTNIQREVWSKWSTHE